MLLIVSVLRDGRTIECWSTGGKCVRFRPKVAPYFWTFVTEENPVGRILHRKLLSAPKKVREVIQVVCRNVYDVKHISRNLSTAFETQVRYKERLAQDCGFKQADVDSVDAAFDVEIESTGQFPRADRNPLIAIAYYGRRYQKVWTTHDMPEYELVSKLCDHVGRENVDIVGTYSGTALDYDYPAARAQILGVDFPLGRRDDPPYTKTRTFETGKRVGVDKTTFLRGRICFDLYKEALFDTSLSGVRHGLKPVCRFLFGDRFIEEVDRQRIDMLSREELGSYCFSDARITYKLLEHYLSTLKPLAVMLKVPLDMMIGRKPSHIGNLVYGRAYNTLGVISDGSNADRFTGVLW